MKEALKDIHHEQNTERNAGEDAVANEGSEPVDVEGGNHSLLPEDGGELGVSKRKGPKTKVGGSIGNHTQDELDSLDGLVDKDLTKAVIVVFIGLAVLLVIVSMVMNSALMLLGKEVGLGEEEDGNGSEGDEEEDVLHSSLSLVHGLVNVAWLKGNIDQGGDQVIANKQRYAFQ